MNALQRAQQIAGRLAEVDQARKYEMEAEALQNKLELLKQQRTVLQSAIATAIVLVNNGALDASALPAMSKAKESVSKVAEAFEGDTRTLTSGRAFNTLLRNLEKTAEAVTDISGIAWSDATSTIPRPNPKLLSRIEEIKSQRSAVQRLRVAADALVSATKVPPSTQEQWDVYAEQRRQVEDLVETLNADRFPQAVLEFCKKAQGEGAPLDMLTPEVKKWLEENNMYDDLRFRLV
ncbi:MAG: hypothetical protein R6X02_34595 [Enhygromyxa sp.]